MSWISVKKLLPIPARCWDGEDSKYYWVYDKYGNQFSASFEQWGGEEEPVWIQFGRDGYKAEEITHWQFLPEPPEGE